MLQTTPTTRITIKEVASAAGVSISTVSYALNNNSRISEETKIKVHEAARKLGYRRNRLASAMRRQRTSTIGVLIPNLSNPFYAEFLQGAEREAAKAHYGLFLCDTREGHEWMVNYVNLLLENQVDGILFAQGEQLTDEIAELLKKSAVPVCYQATEPNKFAYKKTMSAVGANLAIGMREAVRYLVNLGHRRIACVGTRKNSNCPVFRSFLEATAEVSLKVNEWQLIDRTYFTPEEAQDIVRRLMAFPKLPTAVVGAEDLIAAEIISEARKFGLRVPEDLSIIGTDDIFFSSKLSPPLTTISMPRFELGATAMRLLLEQPSRGIDRVVLPTTLIVRESCTRV